MDQILSSKEREARRIRDAIKLVPFRDLVSPSEPKLSSSNKLSVLRDQLLSRRRSIIIAAAETNTTPSHSAIRQIAEIQIAIEAIESVQDEDGAP